MPVTVPKKSPKLSKTLNMKSSEHSGYNKDEIPWFPQISNHIYQAKGFMREMVILEPPGSYDGSLGSFKFLVDKKGTELVVKMAPNEVLNNPSYIHQYLENTYGRKFGDDSSKTHAFKKSVAEKKEKWHTYRHKMVFQGEPAGDLGYSWYDYVELEVGRKTIPILIFELKSIAPIYEPSTETGSLRVKKYKCGPKKTDKDKELQAANKIVQALLRNGYSLDKIAEVASTKKHDEEMFDKSDTSANKRARN